MSLSLDPNYVVRDHELDGVPSSGPHKVRKAELRQLLTGFRQALIALIAEADPEIELPNLLISWGITGGDENDIEATPSGSHSPGEQLHSITFAQPNTGPMTLNGKPFLLNNGAPIPAEYFPADVSALFRETAADFRLYTFGDPEAVMAAVEALYQQARDEADRAKDEADRAEQAAGQAEAIVGFDGTAATVGFDNTDAELPGDPDNVQDALEALAARVDGGVGLENIVTPLDFDAKGDAVALMVSATIAQGSTALTAEGANFTSADVGKSITVFGAGYGAGRLATTIATVGGAESVTLADAAETALSSAIVEVLYGTNDSAALAAMFDHAKQNPGTVMDGLNRWYRVDDEGLLEVFDDFHLARIKLDCSGAADNSTMLAGGGTEEAPVALTADRNPGSTTLPLVSAAGIRPGDWGFVEEDRSWGLPGGSAEGWASELVQVLSVSGNTLTLADTLSYDYRTAENSRFTKINPVRNVKMDDVEARGNAIPRRTDDPNDPFLGQAPQTFMRPRFIQTLRINNFRGRDFGSRIIGFDACWDVEIDNPTLRGLPDGEGLNYGIVPTRGCTHVNVRGGTYSHFRHAGASGGSRRVNRFIHWSDMHIRSNHDNSALDAHRDSDMVTATNIHIQGGRDDIDGILFQCACAIIDGVYGTGHFASLVRHQVLTGYERATVQSSISRVVLNSGRCVTAIVFYQHMSSQDSGALNIERVQSPGRNLSGHRSNMGILVNVNTAAVVRKMNISGYAINRTDNESILVAVNTAGGAVDHFTIGPGVAECTDNSSPVLRLMANSGSIRDGILMGNQAVAGSHSIRAQGTARIRHGLNSDRNSTNGESIDGAL